ncbi:LPS O-antigen length regulator [mine drainage metagenome]|uniref:LPS O-antigen length regulator n=1 Tax=mine drainage metagenome TaxID=410659 RepID=A0A1J5SBH5_9ZZZZ
MSENQAITPSVQNMPDDDEINLLDLLIVLAKHKAMILKITLGAALLAIGVSLLMSNVYTGTAKILPPQQGQSSASALLGQLGGLAGLAGGAMGIKNPADMYLAMFKSRTLMEKIANRFGLQQIYETKTLTDTLNALESNSTFTAGKDGVITVEISDHDQKRAADMANAFVEELAKMMQDFAITDASKKRAFFEQQMKQAKDKLTDAELHLDKTPNTSLQYLDAVRNVKYQEAVWEILAKQFEMAKLDEAKDFPLIQVLDKATPPEKKSKPKRSLIVLLATLVAFFLAVLWAFIRESLFRVKQQPEQAERMRTLHNACKWRA